MMFFVVDTSISVLVVPRGVVELDAKKMNPVIYPHDQGRCGNDFNSK
jgi:hypothetical protein